MSVLFLLGASDPEMRRIEEILKEQGWEYQPAMKDGKRVHPGNAYQADAISGEWSQIILVECQPISLPQEAEIIRIDHHREGDPGYGLPPEKFWEASSLGQVWGLLFQDQNTMRSPSQDDLVLAAMDHCPAAAIRNGCPGISEDEVLERKVAEIAFATMRSSKEVWERIAFFQVRLMDAPPLRIGQEVLSDLRADYLGEGYSLDLLAAQVAALSEGYTVLLRHRDALGKPEKWSVSGHASPALIESFMKEWAPAQGLVGIYGVPSRGYAGGYVSQG